MSRKRKFLLQVPALHAALVALTLPGWPGLPSFHARAEDAVRESDRYQNELTRETLEARQFRIEPNPAGKRLEKVYVVTRDVFDRHDPWPLALNTLHATTREDVVRRELLFHEGETWDPERVSETERNLRAKLFLTLARVIPVQGSKPDSVIALVLTKDQWSLRLNNDFTIVGSRLEYLALELEERNLGGRMRNFGVNYQMDLATWRLGEKYLDPYLGGGPLSLEQNASIILSRTGQGVEGGAGELSLTRPLRNLRSEWGWRLAADIQKDTYRYLSNGEIAPVRLATTGETAPYAFERRVFNAMARVTNSKGIDFKHIYSIGWMGTLRDFTLQPSTSSLSPAGRTELASRILPRSENAGMIFVSYEGYRPEYREFLEIDTYALTEDFRLGPRLELEARLANPVFGFASHYFEPLGTLTWREAFGDDLLTASLSGSIRNQPEAELDTAWINRKVSLAIKNVSPRFSIFRLHASTKLTHRSQDVNHEIDTLGGDGPLRGYPSKYFAGSELLVNNLELRTRSLSLKSVHVGGALFWDSGDAFDEGHGFQLHHSVGAGLRVVFPEFNRQAIRADFAVPLEKLTDASPTYFTLQFDQAF